MSIEKELSPEEIAKAIEELGQEYFTEIYIPSTKETIKVKEINADQHKQIIGTAIDDSLFNTDFIKTLYPIFVNILGEDKVKIYTIFDKVAILLSIRQKISDTILVKKDESNKKSKELKISIKDIINEFTSSYIHPEKKIIEDGPFTIELSVPSILKEYEYEKEIHNTDVKVKDFESAEDVKKIVIQEFIGEISKYVTRITIDSKGSLDLTNFPFKNRKMFITKLPSSINSKILEVIKQWKLEIDKFLTISGYKIDIDPVLFVN